MAKRKSEDISRRNFIGASIGAAVVAGVGCSSSSPNSQEGQPGGSTGAGNGKGGAATSSGGSSATNTTNTPTTPSTGGAATPSSSAVTSNGGAATSSSVAANSGGSPAAGGNAANPGAGRSAAPGGRSSASNPTTGGAAPAGAGRTGNPTTGGTTPAAAGRPGNPAGGAAPAGAGRTGSITGGTSPGGAGRPGNPAGGTSPNTGAAGSGSGGTPLVSLVRGTDWVQATMDAIALVGGLPDLSGKVVMLRPNVISKNADYTTSKDVIHGVIKAAKAKNPSKIIVAEDGWNTGNDTIGAMKSLGIYDVCTAEGAEAMDLAKGKYSPRTHASASAFSGGVDFSDEVFNADYVINIPVCKSHAMAKFTMALKAWYGCTQSGRPHDSAWTAPAELHLFKQEGFVVLDATKTTITGGPDNGTVVKSNIVVASKDPIAVDVTGLCIHKYSGGTVISAKGDAWKNNQIKRALALKFPGWLSAATNFEYAQQGVTEHADIMGLVGP